MNDAPFGPMLGDRVRVLTGPWREFVGSVSDYVTSRHGPTRADVELEEGTHTIQDFANLEVLR